MATRGPRADKYGSVMRLTARSPSGEPLAVDLCLTRLVPTKQQHGRQQFGA